MSQADAAFRAVEAGDPTALGNLVGRDPGLAGARNANGVSLLLYACYHRRPELVNTLRPLRSALDIFEAAALGESQCVTEIMDKDPNAIRALSPDGFSPLHLAAFFARTGAMELLLSRDADPDLSAANPSRVRPIHSAAAAGSIEAVRLLIDHGADVNVAQHGGWTPLHSAAHHGRADMVQLLLRAGADPAAVSENGRSPGDMAAEHGHRAVLDLLNADPAK